MMKKILIILAVIFGIFIASLLILPFFFKNDILQLIQKKSTSYMHAELSIGDLSLNMFRHFPDLSVSLTDVTLKGINEFAQDTLVQIPQFQASVNLMSLIQGDEIVINRIFLKQCRFYPTVSTEGKANWDILIEENATKTKPEEVQSTDASQTIRFNDIEIEELSIAYNDYKSSVYAGIDKLNLLLSGNFSNTNTILNINLDINNIFFRQYNSVWLNNIGLAWNADINANLEEQKFGIQKNSLRINDLELDLTGDVEVLDNKYKMNLQLNTPDTQFEQLLALIPKDFKKHLEGVETKGEFTFSALINGEYYKDHLPGFDIQMKVKDAMLKYPSLPESIQAINFGLDINNPGGPADSTVINLNQLAFTIANNPFHASLKVMNINDPQLSGEARGVINFMNLKKALPLKDISLEGIITTDITFNGKYQYIEKEEYEKFTAKGSIALSDILLKNASFPKGISIPKGSITVTPARLNLTDFQAKIYSSDFILKGYLSNYFPYFLKNGVLQGNFSLNSKLINLNEFLKNSPQQQTAEKTTSATGPLEVPKNINLQLNTDIQTLLFDHLTIDNIKGNVQLANAIATLNHLNLSILNGNILVSGKYSSTQPQKPEFDLDLNITDIDINAAYNAFTFIQKSVPIAMNCKGKISSAMKFSAILDQEMNLIMNTANGSGYISSQGILINDNPVMNQVAMLTQNDELSRLSISSLKIEFKLENGNIVVQPFKTTFIGNPVTIYGSQSIDGNLDYTVSMNINKKYFGKDINNMLNAIPGGNNIESLDIDTEIGGTLSKPKVKPNFDKALKQIKKEAEKELKSKAKDSIIKGLNKLFK